MAGPGIRFNDCVFTEPVPLSHWTAPKCACLFVILARDGNWAPRLFQPLCFGEFGNNLSVPLAGNAMRRATNASPLFVSVVPMPFSSIAQRCEIRDQLVWAYNPACQESVAPAQHDLARKLDELEKKHDEQTTQFRLLLASINRLFDPLPVPPRRPIGFSPETVKGG